MNLESMLKRHKLWLLGEVGGNMAVLRGADLDRRYVIRNTSFV